MPFKLMPKRMLIELIYHCIMWMNAFLVKLGVSSEFSPREIVIRQKLDFAKHCKVGFGCYCKTYDEPTPSNDLKPRTHHTICPGPTGNLQGTYKFFCLDTGRVPKRQWFKEMPMPDSVIKMVEAWAKKAEATN